MWTLGLKGLRLHSLCIPKGGQMIFGGGLEIF